MQVLGLRSGACSTALSTGLLGYWSMDEAANASFAKDSSGHNLPAFVSGAPTFVPGGGVQGTGAASFTGSGSLNVTFPNTAQQASGLYIPQGDITFAMWVKTSAASVQGLQVVAGSGCDRIVGNGSGGTLNYNAWSEENPAGSIAINDGNWHHVAYVLDKVNGLIGYVDGVVDTTDVNPVGNCGVGCSGFDWANIYQIGTGGNCRYGAGDFTGMIDDVRFYDHPLSPADVALLYNKTK